MRQTGKRFVKMAAHHLPGRLRDAMLEQFCEDVPPWSVLGRIAPRCGVVSVTAMGAYGAMQGAPTDQAILGTYAQTGYWARRTNDALAAFFRDGSGHYVDVGANIGLTTIPVAQNPRVRCLAIEPEPTNFAHLRANVAAHCPHGNVELRQVAAFSRHATLTFEISASNIGDHRLRLQDGPGQMGEQSRSTIRVVAAPLDDILDAHQRPRAVKIDAQGAEPFIVEGGRRVLSGTDLLICEWSPYMMARMGADPTPMVQFLRDHFRVIGIASGELGSVPRDEPAAIAAEQLLELADRHRADPGRYFDIVGRT
jgi:FkbM family methyltransferase